MNATEYIICSAVYFNDGKQYVHQPINIDKGFVICGHRHHNCFMTAYILNKQRVRAIETQGFLTNTNRFVDRIEAKHIAVKANQVSTEIMKDELFSEDIY